MDLITLDIHGTVAERLDSPQADASAAEPSAEDDEEVITTIAIAVDIGEEPDPGPDNPSP